MNTPTIEIGPLHAALLAKADISEPLAALLANIRRVHPDASPALLAEALTDAAWRACFLLVDAHYESRMGWEPLDVKTYFVANAEDKVNRLIADEIHRKPMDPAHSEWIACSKQPPPVGVQVLAYGAAMRELVGGVCMDVWMWDGRGWWSEGGTEIARGAPVTHWMPLPEPPKP